MLNKNLLRCLLLALMYFLPIVIIYSQPEKEAGKVTVVATLPPLASLVKTVGGEKVDVKYLVPAASDPHQYIPTLSDVAMVSTCDLFVEVGKEPFLGSLPDKRGKMRLSWINWTNANLTIRRGNPHYIWLYPENFKKIAYLVAETLSKLKPEYKQYFMMKAEEFSREIDELVSWIKNYLEVHGANKYAVGLIGSHFTPLIEALGLNYVGPLVETEGGAPSMGDVDRFLNEARKRNIRVIVVLVTQKDSDEGRLARSIAKELGVGIVYLHGLQFKAEDSIIEYYKYTVTALVASLEHGSIQEEEGFRWDLLSLILAATLAGETIILLRWRRSI
ncbi:MAG: hypothetical protein DRJ47_02230 [Thermoprotei archaeon]|nr:MAG: hypothetical protein DRJ47_02230 [Thermoprotei archaeon]